MNYSEYFVNFELIGIGICFGLTAITVMLMVIAHRLDR